MDTTTRPAAPAAIGRRGLALLVGGLLLSSTVWQASILEHYGVLFLVAPWLLALSTRRLGAVTALGLLLGPVALLWAPVWSAVLTAERGPALTWLLTTVDGLLFSGVYPLVVWFGIFCVGVLVGRVDLSEPRVARRLALGGLAGVAAVAAITSGASAAGITVPYDDVAEASFDEDAAMAGGDVAVGSEDVGSEGVASEDVASDDEAFDDETFDDETFDDEAIDVGAGERGAYADLLDTSPHSGRTMWAPQSVSIALAVLGLALAAPSWLQRGLRPLALLGSISLTAYLVHIVLVGDVFEAVVTGTWSAGQAFGLLVGLQASLVALAVLIRWRYRRGPFEWLLKQATGGVRTPIPTPSV